MTRPRIPEMQEFAHYVRRLIEACQTNVYRLTQDHPHVSNSTMRDLSSGRTQPDTATLRRASLALSEALQVARSEDLIDDPFKIAIAKTSVTPENDETLDSVILRSMISLIPAAVPVAATKKEVNPDPSENPIKTPQEIVSWVQHHFYKLSLSEQMETLSKLTAMTSRAIDRWQEGDSDNKNPLESLIAEIARSMTEAEVKTTEDYAKFVLTETFLLSDRHPDIPKFASALQEIMEGRLDPDDEDTFSALGYLAAVLCGGKFEGDVTAMLMSLVFGATGGLEES